MSFNVLLIHRKVLRLALRALRITDVAMEDVVDNNEAPIDESEAGNNQSNEELQGEDSEEEDECRVCRGPAEEG